MLRESATWIARKLSFRWSNAVEPFMSDRVLIWVKAELIGCSILLRGCAGTLLGQVPEHDRKRMVGDWVEGFGKFYIGIHVRLWVGVLFSRSCGGMFGCSLGWYSGCWWLKRAIENIKNGQPIKIVDGFLRLRAGYTKHHVTKCSQCFFLLANMLFRFTVDQNTLYITVLIYNS